MSSRPRSKVSPPVAPAAKPSDPFPGFLEPMLATLSKTIPAGERWIHEIKFDGWRAQAHSHDGKVALYTRRGFNWTERLAGIAAEIERLPGSFVIDGELVAVGGDGMSSNFSALQDDLRRGRQDRLAYYAFDLLYRNGVDLRFRPLSERKSLLAELLGKAELSRIFLSEPFANGPELFSRAAVMELEGIVSKRADSPYRSGRNPWWLKVKAKQRRRFLVTGFVPSRQSIAALHVARPEGNGFVYAATVKTGFGGRLPAQRLRGFLDKIIRERPTDRKAGSQWVKPMLWAEVEYQEQTADGRLRHPSFKGLFASERDDATPLT